MLTPKQQYLLLQNKRRHLWKKERIEKNKGLCVYRPTSRERPYVRKVTPLILKHTDITMTVRPWSRVTNRRSSQDFVQDL